MLIAVIGNKLSFNHIAAISLTSHLSDVLSNVNIVPMSELPNYRPNRQMFGEPDFDNWIVVVNNQAELDVVREKKALIIGVFDGNASLLDIDYSQCKYAITIKDGSSHLLHEDLRDVLVKEKLIYPESHVQTNL